MKTLHHLTLAALLLAGASARAEDYNAYIRALPGLDVNAPDIHCTANQVIPEDTGGYIAVWDQADTGDKLIERRGTNASPDWLTRLTPATEGETTRLLLSGGGTVLWASESRWLLLDNDPASTNRGGLLRSNTWDYPDLDARKIILRNDTLYLQKGQTVTGYDTNLNCLGTQPAALEEGRWRSVEGTWLIDQCDRTNHVLRYATLTDDFEAVNIREIPLAVTVPDGYVSHLPLGANHDTLAVATTVEWAPQTTITFFSLVDRSGNLLWQSRMNGSEHLTGFVMVTNGWLLSGIDFKAADGYCQYLLLLDFIGIPQPRQHYSQSRSWEYIAINTDPPRLLQSCTDDHLIIYDLTLTHEWPPWWWSSEQIIWTAGPPFEPGTPGYWRTPTAPPGG